MSGGSAIFSGSASLTVGTKPENAADLAHLARKLTGRRFFSPKEFVAALEARHGIRVSERTVRERCQLPEADPLHIATNPAFPGRWWIPEAELARLAGLEVSA